jgi:hypothetical protein
MMYGKHPAVIASYDPVAKLCMVDIPGVTDGGNSQEAELSFPVGDKSEHTDIRILPGDRCWVEFVGGDTRYPIITGFRPKHAGNVVDYRRFEHKHIESDADETQKHTAGTTYRIEAVDSATIICDDAFVKVEPGKLTLAVGAEIIELTEDGFKHNGVQIGRLHTHGGSPTAPPGAVSPTQTPNN